MTSGYYCEIFPFCGGEKKKKKDDKKAKAFYDWATTGIPVIREKQWAFPSLSLYKSFQRCICNERK